MPTLSPSFPPVDAAIAAARRVNWQQVAHRALMVLATVLAVVVAVSSWLWRSGRQFWANHGATITAAIKTAATRTAAATRTVAVHIAAAAVTAWHVASPVLGRFANRAVDAVFHWLADGRPVTLPFRGPTMAL